MTERNPLVGKLPSSDDIDGAQRTGPAGAPAPSGPVPPAKATANGSDGYASTLSGDEALVRAAMCLRNVLVLTAAAREKGPAAESPDTIATPPAGAASATAATAAGQAAANSVKGAKTPAAATPTKGPATPQGSSRNQAKDLTDSEASLLEDAALVKLSYVCLCQHDHAATLRYSRKLLEKNHLLPSSAVDKEVKPTAPAPSATEEAEESKKSWTFQAYNLPHSKDPKATPAKWPSSMGAITSCVLYATEALILAGKLAEAKALLGNFSSNNALSKGLQLQGTYLSEYERGSPSVLATAVVSHERDGEVRHDQHSEGVPPALCGGLHPLTSVGGLTPPSYLVNCSSNAHQAGKDRDKGDAEKEKSASKEGGHAAIITYEPSVYPHLGDQQCMLYSNVAAMHAADGNFEEAQRSCDRALQIQPRALAPLRTLVYLLLRKGQSAEAIRRLKEGRSAQPQR